jgi:hypothetical protein
LNDLFEKALLENQADFVQLFLDHDFPVNDLFENKDKLLDLYKNEVGLYIYINSIFIFLEL